MMETEKMMMIYIKTDCCDDGKMCGGMYVWEQSKTYTAHLSLSSLLSLHHHLPSPFLLPSRRRGTEEGRKRMMMMMD
jgi:hypothetical protein